ncbi:unnamed protein product [Prorocentrum cordatum]|uniref:Uncharacterized protein n=1 Tax=Prorocentrum cordatum TaxID=2364126 RepID=A0ABN9V6I3_9DINO|nr:unnamed protein product [Polarella glacialis]
MPSSDSYATTSSTHTARPLQRATRAVSAPWQEAKPRSERADAICFVAGLGSTKSPFHGTGAKVMEVKASHLLEEASLVRLGIPTIIRVALQHSMLALLKKTTLQRPLSQELGPTTIILPSW